VTFSLVHDALNLTIHAFVSPCGSPDDDDRTSTPWAAHCSFHPSARPPGWLPEQKSALYYGAQEVRDMRCMQDPHGKFRQAAGSRLSRAFCWVQREAGCWPGSMNIYIAAIGMDRSSKKGAGTGPPHRRHAKSWSSSDFFCIFIRNSAFLSNPQIRWRFGFIILH
jgi:hypothetical protein